MIENNTSRITDFQPAHSSSVQHGAQTPERKYNIMENKTSTHKPEVKQEASKQPIVAEQPKKDVPETTKDVRTNNVDRVYQIVNLPSIPPKGKQRQIVLNALNSKGGQPVTAKEVVDFATKAGLTAVAGVQASCLWHLNVIVKSGIAKVLNPTMAATAPAASKAA